MESAVNCRYFISYTGVQLPLQLVNELESDSLQNRISYFKAYYDSLDRVNKIEKIVYGEIEFTHQYQYNQDSKLAQAVVCDSDELPRTLVFDSQGLATET